MSLRRSGREATKKSTAASEKIDPDSYVRSSVISDHEDNVFGRPKRKKNKKKHHRSASLAQVKVMPYRTVKEVIEQSEIQIRLPRDVLVIIFEYLDPKSLGRCLQVCHEWNSILSLYESLWRKSRESCFQSAFNMPDHLEEREFISLCFTKKCEFCSESRSFHVQPFFVFGFAACDKCLKENTLDHWAAKAILESDGLGEDLLATIPSESLDISRHGWPRTEARYWKEDVQAVIDDSFAYSASAIEMGLWLKARAGELKQLQESIKPLKAFSKSSFRAQLVDQEADLSLYKARAKRIQVVILADSLGIEGSLLQYIGSCKFLANPLGPGMNCVPFTENEMKQIALRLRTELVAEKAICERRQMKEKAQVALELLLVESMEDHSFRYPELVQRDSMITGYLVSGSWTPTQRDRAQEAVQADILHLLEIVSRRYSESELAKEIPFGEAISSHALLLYLESSDPHYRKVSRDFGTVTCTVCNPQKRLTFWQLFDYDCSQHFRYCYSHNHAALQGFGLDAPGNLLWQGMKQGVPDEELRISDSDLGDEAETASQAGAPVISVEVDAEANPEANEDAMDLLDEFEEGSPLSPVTYAALSDGNSDEL